MHRILGTYDEFNGLAGRIPVLRMYKKGDMTKPIKEMYLAEIEEPTPAVPLVCRPTSLNGYHADKSYVQPVGRTLGQDSHEALLRRRIEALGGIVELSTSLVSFEMFDDRVVAHLAKTSSNGEVMEETVECQYLVGSEGAHSIVRKNSGMTFLGESIPTAKAIIGDIYVKRGLSTDVRSLQTSSACNCLLSSTGMASLACSARSFRGVSELRCSIYLCQF